MAKKTKTKGKIYEVFEVEEKGKRKEIVKKISPKTRKGLSKKVKRLESKQLAWVLVFMVIVVSVSLYAYFTIMETKDFEYLGFTFDKQEMGDLKFYHTVIDIQRADHSHVNYNLYLRNDPRDLTLYENRITFLSGNSPVYIAISPLLKDCEDATIGLAGLGSFLGAIREVESGLTDAVQAEENNVPHFTCQNSTRNNVFLLKTGDSRLIQKRNNCYWVEIENCDVTKSTEEIILNIIASSRK